VNETAFLLFGIKSVLQSLLEWLKALGPLGLFGISLIDSAGIPLPGGPDVVMIWLTANKPALMPVYALAATAGSAIGCTLLYLVARRAGLAALKHVRPARRDRIENLLGRYDLIAVMVPSVLPPPFPFKPFVLCAGVFRLKTGRFISAIFIGRAVRFLIEGWLAIRFGEDAGGIIRKHGWKVLVLVVLIAIFGFTLNFFRARSRRSDKLSVEQAPSERGSVGRFNRLMGIFLAGIWSTEDKRSNPRIRASNERVHDSSEQSSLEMELFHVAGRVVALTGFGGVNRPYMKVCPDNSDAPSGSAGVRAVIGTVCESCP
jgi:membrane protein YqaA with SNARE-associated domain